MSNGIVNTYVVINTESEEVVSEFDNQFDAIMDAATRNDSEGGYKYKSEAR